MSELSVNELERIAAAETCRDYAAERAQTAQDMRLCDEIEALDAERGADEVESVIAGWKGPDGYPLPGFESPRFVSARKAEYLDWLMSEAGSRTRRNVHPGVEDLLRRGEWENYLGRSYDEQPRRGARMETR